MELLIPGLILVALMVYASTRIKRSAAQAFEPETVETADFTLEKPEGFLNVLNGDPALSFEAYSRDFGAGIASDLRAARVELRVYENRNLSYATSAVKESASIESEIAEVIDGRKYRVLEGTSVEKGVGVRETYKMAEKDGRVFEMKLKVLDEADDELSRSAEALLASFTVK